MIVLVVHDYSTITHVKYALFWPHFRLFSTFIMLELRQSFSSIYNILCRFALNASFLLEIVLVTGGL